MTGEFFNLPEKQNVLLIESRILHEAERFVKSCEYCNPTGSEVPFDCILDRITASDPSVTEYILEEPAKCPQCRHDIFEKTLIEPE